MATVKFQLDPRNPPKRDPAEKRKLDAMTDAEITAAAEADPDNPPLSDSEIARLTAGRLAKQIRRKQGLTQKAFAARYHITYDRLRDIERGRNTRPDTALIAYLRVIAAAPETVLKVLEES